MFAENFEKTSGAVFNKSRHDGPIERARKNYNTKVLVTKATTPNEYGNRSLHEIMEAYKNAVKQKGVIKAIVK